MWLRIALIATLEQVNTTVSAAHITRAVANDVVTARAEQIPIICTVMGLLSMIGPVRLWVSLLMAKSFPP